MTNMTNQNARGKNNCPTDTSTASPQGEDSDAAAEHESAGQTKGHAGDGGPAVGQSDAAPEYLGDNWGVTRRVAEHLDDLVDTQAYIKSRDLVDDLDLDAYQIGQALRALRECEDGPLEIERWSQSAGQTTYRVERKAVADGGCVPVCPECDRTNIWPSSRSQGWYCKDCGATFVDPDRREPETQTGLPSEATQRLDEMDPEEFSELIADGGLPAWAQETTSLEHGTMIRCAECGNEAVDVDGVEHKDGCPAQADIVTDGGHPTGPSPEFAASGHEDRDEPETRLAQARKQLRIASEDIDDAETVTEIVDLLERIEEIENDLGPTVATDGGQQFFAVDEQRRVIVDGPYPTRPEAERAEATDKPNVIILSERALNLAKSERPIRDERGDVDVVTDGGQPTGAIDNGFEDGERDAEQVITERLADIDAPGHHELAAGDVAIDLVTRQPLVVVERVAHNLFTYYDQEEFDLATYKQHAWLPVRSTDAVFECVFVGGLDDLHSFSRTYDYPAGRLARVPIELATDGGEE